MVKVQLNRARPVCLEFSRHDLTTWVLRSLCESCGTAMENKFKATEKDAFQHQDFVQKRPCFRCNK